MRRTVVAILALSTLVACDKAQPEPTEPPAQEEPKPEPKVEKKPEAAGPVKMMVDGKEVKLGSILAWELKLGGTKVQQLYFYSNEVTCEDRLTNEGTVLASAVSILDDGFPVGGPYESPNWSLTGGSLVPLDKATVTITKSDDKEVHGVANYASPNCSTQADCKADADCEAGQTCHAEFNVCLTECPFSVKGEFVAKMCPVYE